MGDAVTPTPGRDRRYRPGADRAGRRAAGCVAWALLSSPAPGGNAVRMANRLHGEASPYLQQHADNPVNWQPWDAAALAEARERNVPILLSIGYAACHWCHVMAHESFEDNATAAVMNALFVNIKVDREERPDLDRIYQMAHQILTRSGGGWPLTVFLDPHTQLPFFSGTYFPREARYNLPGFVDLLHRVSAAWQEKGEELARQGEQIREVFAQLTPPANPDAALPGLDHVQAARTALADSFDATWGGFGSAPKFPMPTSIELLMQHWAYSRRSGNDDREAWDMVIRTLTQMARGGIFDHLGGGFCRYSTDRKWMVPHFEKMLYDNGALLGLYSDALQVGPDALFESAVRDTVGWVLREMRHPDGGFFSSLDADSEGHEGRFYVWRREQVKRLLTEDEYLVVETLYGLDKPANFENRWNLHRHDAWLAVVDRLSMQRERAEALLASARKKLFEAREQRQRPARDDKILTAWNALMIRGLARAARVLDEPQWLAAARAATDFVRSELWDGHRLMAVWKDGNARQNGYLDDYANLLDALLVLLESGWRHSDYELALDIADAMLDGFADPDEGGLFFTSHDHEQLIHRPKPVMDDAIAAGNGVAARALGRLGHLSGEPRYLDAAAHILRWAGASIERYPAGHASLLVALRDQLEPPLQVVIRGPEADIDVWQRRARAGGFRPWQLTYAIPTDSAPTRRLPAYLPRMMSTTSMNAVTAYVCSELSCSAPIGTLDELVAALGV